MKKKSKYTVPIISGGNVLKVKVTKETKRNTHFKIQFQDGKYKLPTVNFREWIYIVGVKPGDLKQPKKK